MSRQINQPINQVRLTNVAVVKYTYKGKRFEIACYRNKVMDFRSGFERDLSEVLQSDRIFTNVSKGEFAKSADLEKVFGTRDEEAIAKIILEKGDFQLSDLERQQVLDNTLSQIATQIASNCVHPETKRPYTVSQIKTALSNYHFQTHKPIKKQYLDAIKFLKQSMQIERAKMELALRYPVNRQETVQAAFCEIAHDLVKDKSGPGLMVVHVDPSLYRDLNDLATKVKGRLEILQQVVTIVEAGAVPVELEQQQPVAAPSTSAKQQLSVGGGGGGADEEEQEYILAKLQAVGIVRTGDESVRPNRKQQRQQQKKSKKSQRRQDLHPEEEESGGDGEDDVDASPAAHGALADGAPASSSSSSSSKSCNTCGGSFFSAADYRSHFRSDWHRFNQKLKLKGVPSVTEEEFRLCDAETFFGKEER